MFVVFVVAVVFWVCFVCFDYFFLVSISLLSSCVLVQLYKVNTGMTSKLSSLTIALAIQWLISLTLEVCDQDQGHQV